MDSFPATTPYTMGASNKTVAESQTILVASNQNPNTFINDDIEQPWKDRCIRTAGFTT